MINRRNYKNFCVLLALTSISCSDSEGWMSSIPLLMRKFHLLLPCRKDGVGDKVLVISQEL